MRASPAPWRSNGGQKLTEKTRFFWEKKIDDECYTPAYAVAPIVPFLAKFRTIWCPFDTDESEFVKQLKAAGHRVVFGHKDDGNNFFDFGNGLFATEILACDAIVSNPPFHNKRLIMERIIALGKPFAMLLPMTWLNDSSPFQLFQNLDLELMIFDKRIAFINKGKQPNFACGYWCHGILQKQIMFCPLNKNSRV